MTRRFALTFDYLCPFARIANEIVITAIEDGGDWEVEFRPFSLSQTKVADGAIPVWELTAGSEGTRGVRALCWAIAVRDRFPDRFLEFHRALYDARFTDGAAIDEEPVLRSVAGSVGLDPDAVAAIVAGGEPADTLGREHTELVKRWAVFGVPTFIAEDEAVFVRLMARHRRDDVEHVLDMLGRTTLNEFKRTRVPR